MWPDTGKWNFSLKSFSLIQDMTETRIKHFLNNDIELALMSLDKGLDTSSGHKQS